MMMVIVVRGFIRSGRYAGELWYLVPGAWECCVFLKVVVLQLVSRVVVCEREDVGENERSGVVSGLGYKKGMLEVCHGVDFHSSHT